MSNDDCPEDNNNDRFMALCPDYLSEPAPEETLSAGQEGKLSELFSAVLCTKVVHRDMHTRTGLVSFYVFV